MPLTLRCFTRCSVLCLAAGIVRCKANDLRHLASSEYLYCIQAPKAEGFWGVTSVVASRRLFAHLKRRITAIIDIPWLMENGLLPNANGFKYRLLASQYEPKYSPRIHWWQQNSHISVLRISRGRSCRNFPYDNCQLVSQPGRWAPTSGQQVGWSCSHNGKTPQWVGSEILQERGNRHCAALQGWSQGDCRQLLPSFPNNPRVHIERQQAVMNKFAFSYSNHTTSKLNMIYNRWERGQ